MEAFREFLYPLGYISSILFGARFLHQWISSERQKRSVVPPLFWKFSLVGNLALWLHSTIQGQFHVALIQAINSVISWRNLNLSGPFSNRFRFITVIIFMGLTTGLTTFLFSIAGGLTLQKASVGMTWHALGTFGLILFSSRFWIQWWSAEKEQTSTLGLNFWKISLLGCLINLIYFIKIRDPVNILGNALGMIPYIRNIMLLYQQSKMENPS